MDSDIQEPIKVAEPSNSSSEEAPAASCIQFKVMDVASYKDCVYWTKRAVEMEKLLRSLKDNKIILDQAKREIAARKKAEASEVNEEPIAGAAAHLPSRDINAPENKGHADAWAETINPSLPGATH